MKVPLTEEHAFDLDAVAAAVTARTKLVFLATPNNPTGTAVATAAVARLVKRVPTDVVVVVDEAYREFADPALGDPVAELLPRFDNVAVARTFSKAYGLASLRLGYVMAHPEITSAIDKCLIPFNVNGLAQAAALAAMRTDAAEEAQANIEAIRDERVRVAAALTADGWDIPDTQANFVWIPLGSRTDEVCIALEQRGVVTRPFSGVGIPGDHRHPRPERPLPSNPGRGGPTRLTPLARPLAARFWGWRVPTGRPGSPGLGSGMLPSGRG